MYNINDKVLYGIHGVCALVDIQLQNVGRNKIEYYVLSPIDQPGARYFVPTQNETAVAKLRPIPSKADLEELLSSELTHKDVWLSDENQRKQRFRELICSADTSSLITMLRAVHKQKRLLQEAGRKFHLCDENFMRDAKRILMTEFSVVLNLTQEETADYLQNILDN